MFEITLQAEDAHPIAYAVVPTLAIDLTIRANDGVPIENILLQCQIQIEATRRKYDAQEQDRLSDLFGTPDRWAETLRSFHWTRVETLVPAFESTTKVELSVPCTFDFNVAATKYFYGLEQGEIPLLLLFSGSIFYRDHDHRLQVAQIPWSKESRYRLPVKVWKEMMEMYYPNCAWLSLRRDLFDRLYQFKCQQGIATWDEVAERLLSREREETWK